MRFSDFRQYRPKPEHNVFAFICSDDLLADESRAVWADAFGGTWRWQKLALKEFEDLGIGRLEEDARTPSLFSESLALFVLNAEKLSKSRIEELAALQGLTNSSLKIVLFSGSPKPPESLSRAFPGVVIDPLRPADAARWLIERYQVNGEIARYLVEAVGASLYPLMREMEKLQAYAAGRDIGARDIDAVVLHSERYGPFEFDDAILGRNYEKAVRVAEAMLDDGVEPLMLLGRIARVWRQLFAGKGLAGKQSAKDVAAAVGAPAFKGADIVSGCNRYEWRNLAAGFRELLEADRALKSSTPNARAYFDVMLWKMLA